MAEHDRPRTTGRCLLAGLVALAAVGVGGVGTAGRAAAGPLADVVVRAPGDGAARADREVRLVGGSPTIQLPIVDGVAARVPAEGLARLRARGLDVAPNAKVVVASALPAAATGTSSTAKPVLLSEIGADRLHAAGTTGTGSVVALVDTGVTQVPDLAGRLVPVDRGMPYPDMDADLAPDAMPCLDLSGADAGDSPDPALDEPAEGHPCDDEYGHGTFLAGLIAGSGAASGGLYKGVAPDARILSIKIASADGSSDVSKVLAAIQYVVSFKDHYGVDVLNLSLGTDSLQDPSIDPLNQAVQAAWKAGITVVVAAGNRGPSTGTLSKPGDDPFVITVAATDDRETPAIDDDRVPRFSSRGGPVAGTPVVQKAPDVAAPGTRVFSVLPEGTTIDQVLDAKGSPALPGGYRRASGTSMSAAVVSGAAALLASQPRLVPWAPGQVKQALRATARKVSLTDPLAVGRGQIDVHAASRLLAPADATAGLAAGDGSGSLDASRGSLRVVAVCDERRAVLDPGCGDEIAGETTAQGGPYDDDQVVAEVLPEGTSWYGTSWYGTSWYGTSWYGTSWYGTSWYGTSWYTAEAEQGQSWDGNQDGTVLGTAPPGSRIYGLWS